MTDSDHPGLNVPEIACVFVDPGTTIGARVTCAKARSAIAGLWMPH